MNSDELIRASMLIIGYSIAFLIATTIGFGDAALYVGLVIGTLSQVFLRFHA
jgi:phosphate/sulfate permease